MLIQGVLFTLLTGVIWSLIGVVYSKATEKENCFYSFLFLSAVCFVVTAWGGTPPQAANGHDILLVAAVILPAGFAGQFGFLALREAMRRGNHAVSWSIAQSAMLCPFAAGMLFFGDPLQPLRLVGMLILLVSLIPLGWPSKLEAARPRSHQIFLIFAWSAFALLGVQQTLTLLPNQMLAADSPALSWRLPLLSLCGLSWLVVAIRKKERNYRAILGLAILYGVLVAAGQWSLFRSLDFLAPVNASGMAYPLAVGSCIILFFGYSIFVRKERCGMTGATGVILAAAGILFLALAAI